MVETRELNLTSTTSIEYSSVIIITFDTESTFGLKHDLVIVRPYNSCRTL
jgi:hypothetical protein